MALKVSWILEAELQYKKTVAYLESNWTEREIYNLESKLLKVLELISVQPFIFPVSPSIKNIRRARIDVNNCLLYRVDEDKGDIKILTFCSTRQQPLH